MPRKGRDIHEGARRTAKTHEEGLTAFADNQRQDPSAISWHRCDFVLFVEIPLSGHYFVSKERVQDPAIRSPQLQAGKANREKISNGLTLRAFSEVEEGIAGEINSCLICVHARAGSINQAEAFPGAAVVGFATGATPVQMPYVRARASRSLRYLKRPSIFRRPAGARSL